MAPDLSQKPAFYDFIRRLLALKLIEKDEKLNLTESQKKEIKNKIKNQEQRFYEELRKYYRTVYLPEKNKFKKFDLGYATFGETFVDKEIYNRLKSEEKSLKSCRRW